jgi:hypothetical protein
MVPCRRLALPPPVTETSPACRLRATECGTSKEREWSSNGRLLDPAAGRHPQAAAPRRRPTPADRRGAGPVARRRRCPPAGARHPRPPTKPSLVARCRRPAPRRRRGAAATRRGGAAARPAGRSGPMATTRARAATTRCARLNASRGPGARLRLAAGWRTGPARPALGALASGPAPAGCQARLVQPPRRRRWHPDEDHRLRAGYAQG